MKQSSNTHFVLIPSYNPGEKVYETVKNARHYWPLVWVVVDGSNDGTLEGLRTMSSEDRGLKIISLPKNMGKGAAILFGIDLASKEGLTHVLTMDSDGQHPAERITNFMKESICKPDCMILGVPVFDSCAPALRVKGRLISNFWVNLETMWCGIGDSLFGFRVYPIEPLRQIMHQQRWMRRFDFDAEAVVRLSWRNIKAINLPAPVKYFDEANGGVSHFNYRRDNLLLIWMHTRLFINFVIYLPFLVVMRLKEYKMTIVNNKDENRK